MIRPGEIVLFPFPHTDQIKSKLRPALLIAKTPGNYQDWLVCMISSQLHHEVGGVDEVIQKSDSDFISSGLKADSLIRLGRLAVIEDNLLIGSIGDISPERLKRIKNKIIYWIEAD